MNRNCFFIVLFFIGCSSQRSDPPGAESITAEELARHIAVLASDEFEGRQPSTIGEDKTISYLQDEFEKIGAQPGNGNSWLQPMELVEIVSTPDKKLSVEGGSKTVDLDYESDFVAQSAHLASEVRVRDAELIFCGYGILAPEYGWNDFAGLNLKNKIIVALVNDPGYATRDSGSFNGKAMTYYGRWTYKYEEAARQGAAGILIVHETGAASYPWEVVRNGWTGPQFHLKGTDGNASRCPMEGWITTGKAREIFAAAGKDFDALMTAAAKPGFAPVPLGVRTSISIRNTVRETVSNNVLALLPGRTRPGEMVIYTAHWDHFGKDTTLEGDQIYNGARDNATGTAALMVLAKAFASLPEAPERSILFIAVTAEEQGLLGSQYYAENPVYPLNKTVAALNMDGMNIYGRMKDITVIGYGNSELDDYVARAAKKQNRTVHPDPEPERGGFYRSDHFNFAKQGVPALYTRMGTEHESKGKEWTKQQTDRYTAELYHKPGDEYDPETWDLAGLVDDVRLLFHVGYELANGTDWPRWRDGTEFKAKRQTQLAGKE